MSGGASARCAAKLESVTFSECNPRPSQGDYPECWNYELMVSDAPSGGSCLPKSADFFITGYGGLADQKHVAITYDADPPTRAKLVQDRKDDSPMSDDKANGKELGEIVFVNGAPSELVFGKGMQSHVGSKSIRRQE